MRPGGHNKRPKRAPGTFVESSPDGLENQPKRAKKFANGSKMNGKQVVRACMQGTKLNSEVGTADAVEGTKLDSEASMKPSWQNDEEEDKDMDECDWEEGLVRASSSLAGDKNGQVNSVTVEFLATPDSSNRKNVQRFTTEEKEVAELVHKVHLLCMIARGRLIDNACNDPLIQAALLSQLPREMLKISDNTKLTVGALNPLVTWFHKNFRVRCTTVARKSFSSSLSLALGTQEGSPEEVVALSVALFRALNLSARFVSILDVASLKPERDKSKVSHVNANGEPEDIFNTSTMMVTVPNQALKCCAESSLSQGKGKRGTSLLGLGKIEVENLSRQSEAEKSDIVSDLRMKNPSLVEAGNHGEHAQSSKRKGDLEFERQMEIALAATAAATPKKKYDSHVTASVSAPSSVSSPSTPLRTEGPSSSSNNISTAIGSEKVGAPSCWAEVYCNGENMTGKWVHVDVVHALIDAELKVEAAVSACKKSLRYVVAFSGNGAKEVTRRYCAQWHKISSKRVNSTWWDTVLAPLKELESGPTGGVPYVDPHESEDAPSMKFNGAEMSSLEDMELQTRALTEPLPTNQLAYRNHSLYALERWLTKYQILYPKGPVLGLVSGNPVYPRSCVQTLHTKERWLREGLQVGADEHPVKVVKSATKLCKVRDSGADAPDEIGSDGFVSLYGKWQTEPLRLQPAINGIVPKNDRGQVDVWSEKCLPPGTVHLKLPRLFHIAKRLDIDYAPAMVGFEFRNGRSVPVFEGIVVCTEFKDAILEAYAEEEERRAEEEKKRDERQALSRWYQLLHSIIIRRKLDNSYRHNSVKQTTPTAPKTDDRRKLVASSGGDSGNSPSRDDSAPETLKHSSTRTLGEAHEHAFVVEDRSFNDADGTLIRTKRCDCGFMVQVEEL